MKAADLSILELSAGNGYGERLKESQVYWFGSDEVYGYYRSDRHITILKARNWLSPLRTAQSLECGE